MWTGNIELKLNKHIFMKISTALCKIIWYRKTCCNTSLWPGHSTLFKWSPWGRKGPRL